jgi:hypothetical protein
VRTHARPRDANVDRLRAQRRIRVVRHPTRFRADAEIEHRAIRRRRRRAARSDGFQGHVDFHVLLRRVFALEAA